VAPRLRHGKSSARISTDLHPLRILSAETPETHTAFKPEIVGERIAAPRAEEAALLLNRRIAMQESMQEAYTELVSLLRDQLARKDERIAMLEAQLEEAYRRAGRSTLSAEESTTCTQERAACASAGNVREAVAALGPAAPIRLPDLGPPNTVI